VLDYAGGDVIHISAGFAGLASTLLIGKRKIVSENRNETPPPHNVMLVYLGAAILWVGWFGFNAGSAIAANQSASMAMLCTHISGCASGVSWMITEWVLRKKPSVLGLVSGAISGLVVITPACGYVDQTGAFFMGVIAGPCCYFAIKIKEKMGFDDALDAFGVHGVGGVVGGILTGFFANKNISGKEEANGLFYGRPKQVYIQLYGIVVVAAYSFVMTLILQKSLDAVLKAVTGIGIRVTEEVEELGLDLSEHGDIIPGHVTKLYRPPAAYDANQSWDAANSVPTKTTRVLPLPLTSDTPRPIEPLAQSGVLTVTDYD